MAQLFLTAAGAVIGNAILPGVGGYIGGMIGTLAGNLLFPPHARQQPGLNDLRVGSAEYGRNIPRLIGSQIIAGDAMWNTKKRATTTTSGGKGGQPAQSTTTYDMDIFFLMTNNVSAGLGRILEDGKLIWTNMVGATSISIAASEDTLTWDRMTFYDGNPAQLPDPTYEAAVGIGHAPAYRGRTCIFIQGLKLGQSGALRNLTFEIFSDAAFGSATSIAAKKTGTGTDDQYVGSFNTNLACLPLSGQIWIRHYLGSTLWFAIELIDMNTGTTLQSFANSSIYVNIYANPCAVMDDGSCIVGGAGFTRINRLTTSGSNYILDTAGGNGYYGMIADGADLWGMNGQLYRISSINWLTNFCVDTAVTGATTSPNIFNRFAYNAAGIPGRIYYRNSAARISYVDKATMTAMRPATDIPIDSGRTLFVVGFDGYIYVPDGTLKKYDPDGNFIASCVVPSLDNVFLQDHLGFVWVTGTQATIPGFFKIRASTMVVESFVPGKDFTGAGFNANTILGEPISGGVAVDGDFAKYGSTYAGFSNTTGVSLGLIAFSTQISPACPSLKVAAERISGWCGLDPSHIDTTGLSVITKPVCSLALSQATSTRTPFELLMSTHFFEMTGGEKIKMVARGGTPVATIPFDDLAAFLDGEDPDPLPMQQMNDIEVPAMVALTYLNTANDYQTDTQNSDRVLSTQAMTLAPLTVPMGMTPTEAKQVADCILLDAVAAMVTVRFAVLGHYARLEPTDPVLVTDKDGSVFRVRILKKIDKYPLLEFEGVFDDTSAISSQGITNLDYTTSTVVSPPADTLLRFMDIPILRDEDDNGGFYLAAKGTSDLYPGTSIINSVDNVNFENKDSILEVAVFGVCTTILGNWTGNRVFDEMNSTIVDVGDGALLSTTIDLLLNGARTNVMLIGNEIIQFRLATLISAGVYKLTGLIRGCRGTEQYMTGHGAGERAILLRGAGLRRIAMTNAEINVTKYWKGVTLGRPWSSAVSQAFTDTGVGLMPMAPVCGIVTRDTSNNAVISFQRRTRLEVRMIGVLGINIPLGEDFESYDIEFFTDGTYTTIVRTEPVASPTYAYSAADQTTDTLTPGNPIYYRAYQISGTVGRGFKLEGVG